MATILVLIALLVSSASTACYYPDGSAAQDTPCTDSTTQSSCCGTGYACLGLTSSYFLCQSTGDEFQKAGASTYVRGSCTDKTWRSSSCPNVCVDPNRDLLAGGNGVARCPQSDRLFYCISTGLGSENCSTGHNLINFLVKPSILTTIGILPSTSSATATTSPTRSSTESSAPSTSSPSSTGTTDPAATALGSPASASNNATTIGVAVGVSVGGLGLIAAAVAIWLLVRKKRRSFAQGPGGNFPTAYDPYKQPAYVVPIEAPANEQATRFELPSSMDSRYSRHLNS